LALFDRFLRQFLSDGTLDITLPGGAQRRYGSGAEPRVALQIVDPEVPRRLILAPELALGESYMDGGLHIPDADLVRFCKLLLTNRRRNTPLPLRALDLLARARRRFDQANPVGRARRNVAHHYDLDGRLYGLFLDADRQYSCAYFTDAAMTLEAAQAAKKRHIAAKLCLRPGQRVLDIGCGWGGMALTLARDHGTEVVGVTLSQEQQAYARDRVAKAGLSDRIDIRLQDYRDLDERFDRIVSVGMFEHVGAPHYREFFDTLDRLLAEDGVALLHTIGRLGPPDPASPWFRKYIFPGGYIPSLSEIAPPLERTGLKLADLEVLRQHYALTLRHWREACEAARDRIEALYDARFYRMWRFYLSMMEAAFDIGNVAVFQLQMQKGGQQVPLTRDYLCRA
jgi:cyclopropane-fatty-acyl-phospholipid synthase